MLDNEVNHYVILIGIDCDWYSSAMIQHAQKEVCHGHKEP
jgi:hypothetical protein